MGLGMPPDSELGGIMTSRLEGGDEEGAGVLWFPGDLLRVLGVGSMALEEGEVLVYPPASRGRTRRGILSTG